MRQRHWIELFSDYDCEIRYHPGKANVVADALSRKERIKPRRVRAINMTLESSIKDKILGGKASDEIAECNNGLMRMNENSKYSVHPEADKMYYDLRDMYWWLGMKKDVAMLYLDKIVVRHEVPVSIISDRDDHFTLRFWQSMQEALGTRLDRIKDRLKTTRDRQKSYADKRRKHLEFEVGDHVMLKVVPWKGVVRFGKKGKLAPRFVGPFDITERIGKTPSSTFDVLQLMSDKLNFVEEPMEILEREFKKLK
ncbi:putative reverse transcriptase domain-containing protein [Tanacetum coccineum]